MFKTFGEIKEAIKNDTTLPFKIVTEGETYFTVENDEGYRAYMQFHTSIYGYVSFYTVHKPNTKTGSGYEFVVRPVDMSYQEIIQTLNKTLDASKRNIVLGKEKMDTRVPHESKKYFV